MRLFLKLLVLALVPFALYARAVSFDYVQADDTDLIRDNMPFLQDLGNVGEAFRRSYFETGAQPSDRKTYYRPLVVTSFILDAQISGASPRGYHLTNVFIHTAAVLLLFAFLRVSGAGDTPSFLAALLFAVHPANVQAVAWIPGRNDPLMAAFGLVTLIALARYSKSGVGWWLAAHATAFAAALFTKESALALVVSFVAYVMLWPDAGDRRRLRHVLVVDVPIVVVWYALRSAALAGGGDGRGVVNSMRAIGLNAQDILLYIGKIIFPVHLNVMPGVTPVDVILGIAALLVLAWLLARLDAGRRWFIVAWLLLFLLPALSVPGLPAYEHRLYFPLMAVAAGVASLPVWRARDVWRGRALWATAAFCVAFVARASAHMPVFNNRYSYWGSATAGTPWAGMAHVNLGQIAESDGDLATAASHYRDALVADTRTPGAHNNLGVLAARAGRLEEAKAEFEQEVRLHPGNADASFNLGLIFKMTNHPDEAASWWERAIAANPGHADAHSELAAYYGAKGDAARAARHAEEARRLTGSR